MGTASKQKLFVERALQYLNPNDSEDLIEALQDWRAERTNPKVCEDIGLILIKGDGRIGGVDDERTLVFLRNIFIEFLNDEECRLRFSAVMNGRLSELSSATIATNTSVAATPQTSFGSDNSSANDVLQHLISTGNMPDDDALLSSSSSVPLSTTSPNYLSTHDFDDLQSNILSHPLLKSSDSSSLGEGFEGTRGFIFRFSLSGIDELLVKEPWCKTFIDRSIVDGCNAFVLNVLVCDSSTTSHNNDEEKQQPQKYSVNWHRDATCAFKPGYDDIKPPVAHSVTVLYVSIPTTLSGGELHLRDPMKRKLWREEGDDDFGVDVKIKPVENMAVVFNGQAEHAVTGHHSSSPASGESSQPRLSLVLEQYRIPVGDVPCLAEFEVVDAREYVRLE
jgi:hypothetical protein